MPSVSVTQLSKSYSSIKALDDVSFDLPKGELFGIIGPDGAGKTTLFRLLTTLILPDSGSAVIEGLDVVKDYIVSGSDSRGKSEFLCYGFQYYCKGKLPSDRRYLQAYRTVQDSPSRETVGRYEAEAGT